MIVKKVLLDANGYPTLLAAIPDAPKQLFYKGTELGDLLARPRVAIVGSRKVTAYGRSVTSELAAGLARLGVVIVSGLAYGVDSIAHRAALEAGGTAIAVLPSGLDAIYPGTHVGLAQQILDQGGALVSEYPPETIAYKSNFVARNRIVSGLSDAVLIPEAAAKSGTLHTAHFALEQGREVLAVPGNITSANSAGTNALIKDGATPITNLADILQALGLEEVQQQALAVGDNPEEQRILDLIMAGTAAASELLAASQQTAANFNQTMTMLEISGKIRALGAGMWSLARG